MASAIAKKEPFLAQGQGFQTPPSCPSPRRLGHSPLQALNSFGFWSHKNPFQPDLQTSPAMLSSPLTAPKDARPSASSSQQPPPQLVEHP
ncbi:hypothetical protein SISNIDRAFT_489388 [Sistotremastrum niveocremeum HHB9708]|uniref:Uncharacterized protein n=1 Tax=Sistotremastrum niveocremeum HHB9708 TaxID=1314777 RepID=A0A164M8R2_9AGAM|nr:hypothetical protein SISNIDRAFT_491932 [Sistotremastrum niveocremeum HHB9708]KZS89437.1 hypothetical protein SISNIDRAFT_489388 [Sistotremastrum niveocremeum HHB9708]